MLATRLTDDPKKTVLLLEAGGDPIDNPDVNIPIFADTALSRMNDDTNLTTKEVHHERQNQRQSRPAF